MGRECRDLSVAPPDQPLFDPRKIVIIGNGRCDADMHFVILFRCLIWCLFQMLEFMFLSSGEYIARTPTFFFFIANHIVTTPYRR